MGVRVWDEALGKEFEEQVYGDALVRWLYGTGPGTGVARRGLSGKLFSQLYGAYQSSALSKRKVEPFIRDFYIPMNEYEPGPFASFNHFFIRKFRPGARAFETDPGVLPAFAEARYFAYTKVDEQTRYPVKGHGLTAEALLGDAEAAKPFLGGPMLLARLCPVDYHRFHFPDDGEWMRHYRVPGRLHSVNPLALQWRDDVLCTNEREVSVLKTSHFGLLAYVEVGAMGVGRIVQSAPTSGRFKRGEEKGYFLFGGSTVMLFGEPGRWVPSQALVDRTSRGLETLVRLGRAVGRGSNS